MAKKKKIELDQENALLSSALNLMGYKPNTIVVELNDLIINSIKWEKVKLKDGDNLEIISIVGGGDTLAAIKNTDYQKLFTHLSTAGGAFLESLEGKQLPGVKVLTN